MRGVAIDRATLEDYREGSSLTRGTAAWVASRAGPSLLGIACGSRLSPRALPVENHQWRRA